MTLKLISFNNQKKPFPLHFHNEYCISLINSGIEVIQTRNERCYGNSNNITITHPYELHANPLYSKDTTISFDTIYVDKSLFLKLSPINSLIKFENRIITSAIAKELFLKIKHAKLQNDLPLSNELMTELISELINCSDIQPGYEPTKPLENWEIIDEYIDNNIFESISLDNLAECVFLNKFTFSRNFKNSTGMTPINYVIMKKIFHSKDALDPTSSIYSAALDYGFTDTAHYSKFFKRFIGISPLEYRSTL
jgi:AraC-like DNA-binding protein